MILPIAVGQILDRLSNIIMNKLSQRGRRWGAVYFGCYSVVTVIIIFLVGITATNTTAYSGEKADRTVQRLGGILPSGEYLTAIENSHNHALSTRDTLFAVQNIDDDLSIAVGAMGLFVKILKSGLIKTIPIATETNFFSVTKTGDGQLWVGAERGVLYRSDLTLAKWEHLSLDVKENIFKIIEKADHSLIAIGSYGLLMASNKLRDGWTSIGVDWGSLLKDAWDEFGESYPHLYSACTNKKGEIIVVGEFGLILKGTSNHFEKIHGGAIESAVFDCLISDEGRTIIAVGQMGLVLKSTDAGSSWARLFTGQDSDLYRIQYFDDVFLALGDGKKLYLSDDGTEWRCIQLKSEKSLGWYVDAAINNNEIQFVGNGGSVTTITRAVLHDAKNNSGNTKEFITCG